MSDDQPGSDPTTGPAHRRRRPDKDRMTSYPVSIKGVVLRDQRVLLLRNRRDEWELPGGRLEVGETPAQCLTRELAEETGWQITAGPILDSWLFHIAQAGKHVFVVTYGCYLQPGQEHADPVLSHEHDGVGLIPRDEVDGLRMPQGYKHSIAAWFATQDTAALPHP